MAGRAHLVAGWVMESQQHRQTVARLDREYIRDPEAYRRRVVIVGVLGYACIYVVPVLALTFTIAFFAQLASGAGGLAVALSALIAVACTYMTVAGIRLRLEPPSGVLLNWKNARRVLDIAAALRAAMGAPRPELVMLNGEMTASMVQVPRLGVFGWHRNYMVVGLPLLMSVTVDEFKAVLAHEFGYYASTHGRFAVWLFRQRALWLRILDALEQQGGLGNVYFTMVARWFALTLGMYSHAITRQHDLDTDRVAAKLAGADHFARALVRVTATSAWLEEKFWPEVQRSARAGTTPPEHVYDSLSRSLADVPATLEGLRPFLRDPEDALLAGRDLHAPLSERLRALQQPNEAPPARVQSAAQELLGNSLVAAEQALSDVWRRTSASLWQSLNQEAIEQRARLEALDARRKAGHLSRDEAWERAELLSAEGRESDYEHAVQAIAAANPRFAPALFAYGQALLRRGDDQGLKVLDRAMEAGEGGVYEACQSAYEFLVTRGRAQEAEEYTKRSEEYLKKVARAKAERRSHTIRDPIEPHGLGAYGVGGIRMQFMTHPEVQEAYLVRKKVQYLRDVPIYVVAVRVKTAWYRTKRGHRIDIRRRLERKLEFAGEWFCIVLDEHPKAAQERFIAAAGRPVYERDESPLPSS